MGIATVLRRNQEAIASIGDTIRAFQERKRKEEMERDLADAIAKNTRRQRLATGTTNFSPANAGDPFEPLTFQDREDVDLAGVLGTAKQDNPLVGSYLDRQLLVKRLQDLRKPKTQLQAVDDVLYSIDIPAEGGTPRATPLTPRKPAASKAPKTETRIVTRSVNGKPMQFERTYRDGLYTGEEVEVGEAYVKPSGKAGDMTDADKQRRQDERDAKKRIQELTDRNTAIGQQLAMLSAEADKDADGEIDETEKRNLDMLRQSLQGELDANEEKLERLNIQIGGTWRRSRKGGTGTPGAGTPATTKRTGKINVRLKADVGGYKKGDEGEIDASEFSEDLMEEVQ